MSEYKAPISDMKFVMTELAGLDEVQSLPGCEDVTTDLVDAILGEADKFASNVLSPLNVSGDKEGAHWNNGDVKTAVGWKQAYQQFVEGGWGALACNPEYGGQGLPKLVSTAVLEMWESSNMAFSLCPMLTNGAIEALMLCGTEEQKKAYLPKLISGEWTGTMNLTEPQAGSDLAAVRSKAEPRGDGTYNVFGQKIFITYGDHDMTDNIIHLVLARLPDAPEGVKGISLFVVPKFLLNEDGTPGKRNDVQCVSIEHKLGIHASPTCVLAFGEKGGAIGTLVGEPNRGLEYMFIMMNEARYAVGMEGLSLSERAYQQALEYAKDRIQGTDAGVKGGPKVSIIHHADIRRMLLSMKAQTEAMRAVAYVVGAAMDKAHRAGDDKVRQENQAFVDLMIPIVKGWLTENSIDVTSTGIQVHGGMGFIEETGAAQHYRDARITPIYEGTTGIQATDLVGRKIGREQGVTIKKVIVQMKETLQAVQGRKEPAMVAVASSLDEGIKALERAVDFIVTTFPKNIKQVQAGSVPFLKLFGTVSGGWQMARAALAAQKHVDSGSGDLNFYRAKVLTAYFYAEHVMSQAAGFSRAVCTGFDPVLEMEEQMF